MLRPIVEAHQRLLRKATARQSANSAVVETVLLRPSERVTSRTAVYCRDCTNTSMHSQADYYGPVPIKNGCGDAAIKTQYKKAERINNVGVEPS